MSIRFQTLIVMRFAILALLAGFSFSTYATTYYWYPEPFSSNQYSTAQAACDYWVQRGGPYTGGNARTQASYYYNATAWYCRFQIASNPTGYTSLGYIYLGGDSCASGSVLVPSTGGCVVSNCSNGATINPSTGECTVPPSCPSGQTAFTQVDSSGHIVKTACVQQIQPPAGKPCQTWADNQTNYCQQQQANCTASGGTFGTLNGQNVCIPAGFGGNPIPNCSSGATQFTTNPDGSSSATCVGTSNISGANNVAGQPVSNGSNTAGTSQAQSAADTANNTAAIAKINNEGFQGVVNAINSMSKAGGGGAGAGNASTATQDQQNTAGIISAINDFKNQERGAGQCDPKANNYAECTKQVETAPDSDGSTIRANAITQGNASIDAAGQTVVDGINATSQRSAPSETSSFADTFLSYLPHGDACQDYAFAFKQATVQVKCTDTQTFRDWGAWAFALLTMYAIFEIMFRRPQ